MKEERAVYRIHDVPEHLRPRERFRQAGAENVEDEVLLALILRSGTRGTNVMDIARELLHRFGSLTALATAPESELKKVPGLGPVKIQIIQAALELARRLSREKAVERPVIDTPDAAALQVKELARTAEREFFWILLLDTKNRLMRDPVRITEGILNASLVHPREVFREAIAWSCAAVVLAHNHPSGDPAPSPEDLRVTRKLVEAGAILEVQVLDHLIVGRERTGSDGDWFVSLRESGLVAFKD